MNKKIILLLLLALFLGIVIIISLFCGVDNSDPSQAAVIIWQLRLPRVLLALLVGAGLASAGAVFQALLRNSLAEPYTLGVSSGAALGASLGMLFRLSSIYTTVFAFIGSLLTIFLVYTIAARKRFSNSSLILGGVTLGFLFSSIVLLIIAMVRQEGISNAVIWLMGDLSSASPQAIFLTAVFVSGGILAFFLLGRDVDLICLGEEKAMHIGLDVETIKKILFFIASLVTAACVSASGIIGFVGLIIPHIGRFMFGPKHRVLFIAVSLLGAGFLILCDTIARTVALPLELPVGVITGIFGGIFFLGLLIKAKKW